MRGADSRDALLFWLQMLGPSYLYQQFGDWRLLLSMSLKGGTHISVVVRCAGLYTCLLRASLFCLELIPYCKVSDNVSVDF